MVAMASPGEARLPKRGEQYYGLNRDAKETARLNQQHFLFAKSFGFLIHPSIPFNKPNLCIADCGTGTGVWPIEVSKIVSANCKLDGFDISSAQFPPITTLPANVSLHQHDVLRPLPESYHGYYDIICVRALVTVLADDEWDKAVSNLALCLKPGGWLQWVDPDCTATGLKVIQSEAMAPKAALQKGIDVVRRWAALLGRTLSESNRLPSIFHACGFEAIHHDVMSTDCDASTRTELTVEMTTAFQPLFVRYAQMDGSGITVAEAVKVGERMQKEAEQGKAYLRFDFNIITGRKPEGLQDI